MKGDTRYNTFWTIELMKGEKRTLKSSEVKKSTRRKGYKKPTIVIYGIIVYFSSYLSKWETDIDLYFLSCYFEAIPF